MGRLASGAPRRRSCSTATRATTTRSHSCSRSPAQSCTCWASRQWRETRRSTRRPPTRCASSSSSAARIPVAAGADRPLDRDLFIAAYVHGESGLDGPTLPPPRGTAIEQHAVDFLAEHILGSDRPVTVVPVGPLTNIALLLARYPETAGNVERIVLMGGAIAGT